jgi:AhpD family alkylhydroperoxidase
MEPRLDYMQVLPEGMRFVNALEGYAGRCGLEPLLLELVKLRASQLNGCAYCVDMHSKDARTHGETEQRLYGLSVWRDAPYYTPRERAALALTEAVTLVSRGPVPDDVYAEAQQHFTSEELVKLMVAIAVINTWNRFAITFHDVPGSYEPEHFACRPASAAGQPVA